MKPNKVLAAVLSTILAGSVLAACGDDSSDGGSAGSSTDGLTKVRLAFTPGASTLPVHVAIEKGLFEKHGLDVEATEGLELPSYTAGLDKQWDIAMATPGIWVAAANPLDLVVLAGGQAVKEGSLFGNPLIVRGDDIKTPEDLIGKRVGVPVLTGSTPSSLQYLVQQAGGKASDIELVQVPFDQTGDQLKAGQVDAASSSSPFSVSILADPQNHAIFDAQWEALHDIAPDLESIISIVYGSTRTFAAANPDAAKGFQDALQESQEWMEDPANSAEAKQMMSDWLGYPLDVVERVEWPMPIEARVTAEQLQPNIDLLVAVGVLSEADAPDLSDRFPVDN